MVAAALITLTCALTSGYALFGRTWHTYTTEIGEQRALTLVDGSIIQLNTHSRLKVRLTVGAREVHVLEGEALFKVAHDAVRPFRVHTGDAVITAVGTQFEVYRKPAGTSVEVLEGAVEVAPTAIVDTAAARARHGREATLNQTHHTQVARVAAGEEVDIGSGTGLVRRKLIIPAEVAVWRQRRLVFHNDTLAEIAAEFNRYNRLKIRVEGQAGMARFAGTFDADSPQEFIAAVAPHQELGIERRSNEVVIREREP